MDLVFHIGYHKTATSWLQQSYFREHPEVAVISDSERPWDDRLLSYLIATPDAEFDPEVGKALLAERVRATADALAGRKVLLISAERLSGRPFSGGYDNVRIARRIATTFPDAKIVCVIRNQFDMIWSMYKQLVSEGYPGTLSRLMEQRSWKTTSFDLAYFEYDRLISQYLSLYGKERVCILQYEQLRRDGAAFIGKLCSFLGVDYVEPQRPTTRIYPSLSDASIGIVRRLNYFRRSELYLFSVFDLGRGYGPLRRLAVNLAQYAPWLASQREQHLLRGLGARFSQSNARLAHLLGGEFTEYRL